LRLKSGGRDGRSTEAAQKEPFFVHGKELFAAIDAALNGTSTILLVVGYVFIRQKKVRAHAWLMVSALTTSTAFLVCYVYSKVMYGETSSGLQPGILRTSYLILLASHVILAAGMLPPIIITVWRAYTRHWERHRRIARPTFWIWLYVSVTGVII
jgi:putative membrane protein